MKIRGWRTRSVFESYAIAPQADIAKALDGRMYGVHGMGCSLAVRIPLSASLASRIFRPNLKL
jgi:hypothetical protein